MPIPLTSTTISLLNASTTFTPSPTSALNQINSTTTIIPDILQPQSPHVLSAMLNSTTGTPVHPIGGSRDTSMQSLHHLNGGGSGSFSAGNQQSPRSSRGGSPPSFETANGQKSVANGNGTVFANQRSKRACSLGIAQHRTSIGVTITPPAPTDRPPLLSNGTSYKQNGF